MLIYGECSEYTYRPKWGPTFPLSKLELAVMSTSGITPASIPIGALHCAAKRKQEEGRM